MVGSEDDDEVHVWGGMNLLFLGDGDDTLVVHRSSTVVAIGGRGHDIRCSARHLSADLLVTGFEGRCSVEGLAAAEKAEVVGVLHSEETVWARNEELVEAPTPSSLGGPCSRYQLEIWAVLAGGEPGEDMSIIRPGGNYVWPDGSGLDTPSLESPVPVGSATGLTVFTNEVGGLWRYDRLPASLDAVIEFAAPPSSPRP